MIMGNVCDYCEGETFNPHDTINECTCTHCIHCGIPIGDTSDLLCYNCEIETETPEDYDEY